MKKESPVCVMLVTAFASCFLGFVLGMLTSTMFIPGMDYERGQYDAANGKWEYGYVERPSTRVWVAKGEK